ncbi:hypothetical protein ACOSQ3_032389 [Xanthoceras sorbifolium]
MMASLLERCCGVGVCCPVCGSGLESVSHVLWNCPSLKPVRSECRSWLQRPFNPRRPFLDFFIDVSSPRTELELFCVIVWRYMFRKNRSVHGQLLLPAGKILA